MSDEVDPIDFFNQQGVFPGYGGYESSGPLTQILIDANVLPAKTKLQELLSQIKKNFTDTRVVHFKLLQMWRAYSRILFALGRTLKRFAGVQKMMAVLSKVMTVVSIGYTQRRALRYLIEYSATLEPQFLHAYIALQMQVVAMGTELIVHDLIQARTEQIYTEINNINNFASQM